MKLSVVIVSFNTKEITISCLRSLDRFPYREKFEVIVVDNASSDGSITEIKKYKPKNYTLRTIENRENFGFSKGNNIGIKKANGEYILLLNSDTEVLENSLNLLLNFAQRNKDAGVVAPRLLNSDKTIQASVFRPPTLLKTIRQYWLGEKGEDKYVPSGTTTVEAVVGAAFLITPKGRKTVGLLNEDYFMYFEDLDYCRKIIKSGLKIYYVVDSQIIHHHGKSGEKVSAGKDQWKRLIPSSKIYHGILVHYLRWAVIKSSQKPEIIILPMLVIVALILRFLYFPDNIYFAYDQARDAYMAKEILAGNLKLLGPPSSLSNLGLFHGPLYWYLLTPLYYLFSGSPAAVAGLVRIFNVFSIVLIYFIGKEVATKKTGLIAAAIYAFSFENWQQALYFANPGPAVVTTLVFYYGLARIANNKDKLSDWLITALGLGLSIQLQFYLVYLVVPFLLCLLFLRKPFWGKGTTKNISVFIGALFVTLLTFVVSEVKFQFRTEKGLLAVLGKSDNTVSFFDKFSEWLEKIILTLSDSLSINLTHLPHFILSGLLLVSVIYVYFQSGQKIRRAIVFLGIWIGSTALLFLVVRSNTYYIVGLSAGLVLLFSVVLNNSRVSRTFVAYIVIALLAFNLLAVFKQAKAGIITQISVQEGMRLGDEKKVIDFIYSDSLGEETVVSALTMPYDIYVTWAYLFENYGSRKYGYVPYWIKKSVDGYPGSLPVPNHTVCKRYTIYESVRGMERLEEGFRKDQDLTTRLEFETKIGSFTVEKRFDLACI